MKILVNFLVTLVMTATLGACAARGPVAIGDTEAQVLAARGAPTHRYRVGNEQLLEYNHGPFGQQTYMARITADGRLASFEPVLTDQKFATVKIGEANKANVLLTIGAPSEQTYLPLSRQEVWSYPYKENDIWNMIMHVHFDQAGIVHGMLKTPDTRLNTRDGNLFGAFPR
jgi:hypothetical protein